MKILIIATNVGRTAPGIVFERLIHGLSSIHQVDVLTADFDPSINLSNVSSIIISKRLVFHPRILKFLISIFGVNPYDYFWYYKSIYKFKKTSHKYDLVFSFVYSHQFAPLIAGERISKKYNTKYAVYSVDALPAPGWPENKMYYKGVKRLISSHLKKVDALFSANENMLEYQLSTFSVSDGIKTGVLFNPSLGDFMELPKSNENINTFVYTGGIYGARSPKYLLHGFEKLLDEYPDSCLHFVGGNISSSSLLNLKKSTLGKIFFSPYTKELDQYYIKATALIDIDADIENDVFISSKIINYLMVNRIIISETGQKSPSRKLFYGMNSIIQCNHDVDSMYEAMKKSINIKNSISFIDRESAINLFQLKNVIKRLDKSLLDLILHKKE